MTGFADAHKSLVEIAIADLVNRLDVDRNSVTVISEESVTWPNRSLGCPQPGMGYLQTPVDGSLIKLSVEGTTYHYHSGGSGSPFLCESRGE